MDNKFIIFGVIGRNGAGKSTICDYLSDQGFSVVSLSDIVRSEADKQGLNHTRENLIQIGTELKRDEGLDVLAKRSFNEIIEKSTSKKIVFDSIRLPEEVVFFKSHGAILLGIDAPVETRYTRVSKRKKETDQQSYELFKQLDLHEYEGKSGGQNIKATFQLSDYVIDNDGDLENVHLKIDNILELVKNGSS
ncbi:AAA family ATPase [bacterium]|nr:AAA family ATPase [bacterium]